MIILYLCGYVNMEILKDKLSLHIVCIYICTFMIADIKLYLHNLSLCTRYKN